MTRESPYRIAPSSLLGALRPVRQEVTLLSTVALGFLVLTCTGLALLQCAVWFRFQPAVPDWTWLLGGRIAAGVALGLGARWILRTSGRPGPGRAKSFRVLLPLGWILALALLLLEMEDSGLVAPGAQQWVLAWLGENPEGLPRVLGLGVASLIGAHALLLALRGADPGGASPPETRGDPA
jgi:hypothetical protein